jgi:large subunit ribosomal protein L18
MNNNQHKVHAKGLRKQRVRAKISGGTATRPRLSVTVSLLHVSAQLIDDVNQKTLAAATTIGAKITGTLTDKAASVGTEIGAKAKKAKIKSVVFDRNGRQYALRLKALADAVRQEGIEV